MLVLHGSAWVPSTAVDQAFRSAAVIRRVRSLCLARSFQLAVSNIINVTLVAVYTNLCGDGHKMRNTSSGCMISELRAQHRKRNVRFARCVAVNAAAGQNAVPPSLSGSEPA
eukprot:6301344-Prymnesium_polylepis.1